MTKSEFNPLAKQYMDMVFRLAFSMTKSKADSDDITQNVLFALYKTETVFENNAHIKNWLVRVTVNECRKLWRSPWLKHEDFEAYSDSLIFEEAKYSELYSSIMSLDRKYRIVLLLYYYEGYTIQEISKIMNVPAGTVGTRLSRAREKLRKYLSEDEQND